MAVIALWKTSEKAAISFTANLPASPPARLLFTSGSGILAELVRIIEQEQTCCSFLHFRIGVEPSGGPITFEVMGPAGTREMLLAL